MRVSDLVPWQDRGRGLVRRRSGDPLYAMRQEMNQLFEEFFRGLNKEPDEQFGSSFMPSINLSESADALEATVELPGVTEDDVDITLTRDGLTITGEKRESIENEGTDHVHREHRYGYFQRTIPLPPDLVDRDNVEATFDKGILRITMPKRDEAQTQSRRIPVKVG